MPIDNSIRTLLNPRVLTRHYTEREGQYPTPFTDAFFSSPVDMIDDEVSLFYDPADMEPAPTNHDGAEARVVTVGGGEERIMSLFTVFNKLPFKGVVMKALRELDSNALQEMARAEINRLYGKFVNRHRILKEVILAKTLTAGIVYVNNRGQILEDSTGAVEAADFGVAATHKGNLDGIVSGLWSTAATDIQAHFDAIDEAAAVAGVPAPTDVWINASKMGILRANTQFIAWAQQNGVLATTVLSGGIMEGLFGKTWHFVRGYYKAQDGTTKPLIPLTKAILTPPPGGEWVQASNGATVIPSFNGLTGSLEEALSKLDTVYGQFAYAKIEDDPVRVFAYAGDKFALHFSNPDAIWMPTVFA